MQGSPNPAKTDTFLPRARQTPRPRAPNARRSLAWPRPVPASAFASTHAHAVPSENARPLTLVCARVFRVVRLVDVPQAERDAAAAFSFENPAYRHRGGGNARGGRTPGAGRQPKGPKAARPRGRPRSSTPGGKAPDPGKGAVAAAGWNERHTEGPAGGAAALADADEWYADVAEARYTGVSDDEIARAQLAVLSPPGSHVSSASSDTHSGSSSDSPYEIPFAEPRKASSGAGTGKAPPWSRDVYGKLGHGKHRVYESRGEAAGALARVDADAADTTGTYVDVQGGAGAGDTAAARPRLNSGRSTIRPGSVAARVSIFGGDDLNINTNTDGMGVRGRSDSFA